MIVVLPKVRLRRSDIQNKSACPCYESDESEAARFGSLIHAIVAAWAVCAPYEDNVAGMQGAVDSLLLIPAGVSADRFDEVRQLAVRYAETHDPMVETRWMVEQTLEWENERLIITGTPDRVNRLSTETALLTDIKTAYAPSEASHSWQLKHYSALLFLNEPELQSVVWRADYIRLSESGVFEDVLYRDETLGWWHDEVVPLAESIVARSTEEQQPVGGAACGYCAKRWSCAESVAPYRNAPQTAEDARRIFAETVRLEAGVEERRKALKLWYAEHEPEVVNGLEVGMLQSRDASFKPRVPAAEIAAFLDQRGMDGARVLSLDSAQLRNKAMVSLLVENELGVLEHGAPSFRSRKATG